MESTKLKPILAIIWVNFLWGIDFIVIEYMMEYVPPAIFTLSRLIIGVILLVSLCFIKKGGLHIRKEDMLQIFIAGGVGMALYFTVENEGTALTSASFSALIMATVPIFGMIGDRLVHGNKITLLKIVCVLVSIIGVYLQVRGEPMGISTGGLLVMLAAAILWTFYIVYTKTLYDKYDLLTLLTGLFVSGLIVEIPLAIVSQCVSHAPIVVTPTGIVVTIASAILCIIVGEYFYVYSIGNLSATVTSAFENVLPLTTVIVSLIVFGTMLTGIQIIGAVLILVSVTVIAIRS